MTEPNRPQNRSPIDYLSVAAGATAFLYIYGGVALFIEYWKSGLPAGDILDVLPPRRFLVVGGPIAGGSALVLLGIAWIVGRRLSGAAATFRRSSPAVQLGSFLMASLVAVVVGAWFVIPLRLHEATVETANGCVTGAFIAADAQGVHLANGRAAAEDAHGIARLITIPAAEVRGIAVQGTRRVDQLSISRIPTCPQAREAP